MHHLHAIEDDSSHYLIVCQILRGVYELHPWGLLFLGTTLSGDFSFWGLPFQLYIPRDTILENIAGEITILYCIPVYCTCRLYTET